MEGTRRTVTPAPYGVCVLLIALMISVGLSAEYHANSFRLVPLVIVSVMGVIMAVRLITTSRVASVMLIVGALALAWALTLFLLLGLNHP